MTKNRIVATDEDSRNTIVQASPLHSHGQDSAIEEKIDFVKNIIAQIKDKRVKKIFNIRYFSGNSKKTPWAQIAKEMGVSTQTAINLHNKPISYIRRKMYSKEITTIHTR